MLKRPIAVATIAGVGLASIAALVMTGGRKPPRPVTVEELRAAPLPLEPAGDGGVTRYLDTGDSGTAPCLLALGRAIDAREGYPVPATCTVDPAHPFANDCLAQANGDLRGNVAFITNATAHVIRAIPNCSQQGRWLVVLPPAQALEYAALRTVCTQRVAANEATAACTCIANAPAVVTTLDPSWTPDGGPCWWEVEAGVGAIAAIPAPPDDDAGLP